MFSRHVSAFALRHPVYSILACALAISLPMGQSATAQNAQQNQAASFTLSETQGQCSSITGYGAHFPPGSTVIIAGPQVNGRNESNYARVEKLVATDGTFTVTLQPCPQQMVTPSGTFPVSNGLQFTFTADTRAQNGVGASAIYTVSGLDKPELPNTGVPTIGGSMHIGLMGLPIQPSLSTVVLFLGGLLATLGWFLLLFERARHQES